PTGFAFFSETARRFFALQMRSDAAPAWRTIMVSEEVRTYVPPCLPSIAEGEDPHPEQPASIPDRLNGRGRGDQDGADGNDGLAGPGRRNTPNSHASNSHGRHDFPNFRYDRRIRDRPGSRGQRFRPPDE